MTCVLAAGAVAIGVLAGCGKQEGGVAEGQSANAAATRPPPNVLVAEAAAQSVPVYIDAIGKAVAVESVTITPRISGQIVERRFEDGADVERGQVLFVIDKAPFEAQAAAARASLAQAKAALQLANIELERYNAVAGTNAISKSDLDTRRNAVDVASAQVAAAEAALRTAEINLSYCTIASPINGRAGARQVDVGNVVKADDTSLLSIQSVDPIYADFTVNEQQLADVRTNMANGTLVAHVRLPTEEGLGRTGELTFLDNSVQSSTGTIRLRATLKNADRHFWPGQFLNVRLVLKTLEDAILVPARATQIGQGGPFVLVVQPDGKAEQRDVTLGQAQGDQVVIQRGVTAGERVIVEGQLMVMPGMPVNVTTPDAKPAAAPQAAAGAGATTTKNSPPTTPSVSPTTPGASVDQATAAGAAAGAGGVGPVPANVQQNEQAPSGSSQR